jgi:hypothetical protein
MTNSQQVLYAPFDIETHKRTFINYLEVIISGDGTVMYAVPSHQEKLISIACQKLNVDREELYQLCPKEYYFDIMSWLCLITNCVSLWNEQMVGIANETQKLVIYKLSEEGLYSGTIFE